MAATENRICISKGKGPSGRASLHCSSGVTLLEFTLVFPLFFLTIICIVDFSRYLLLRGILNTAANRAISQASVVPNLDGDCRALPAGQTSAQCAQMRALALRTVLQAAGQLPFGTIVGPAKGSSSNYFSGDASKPAFELILNSRDNWRSFYSTGQEAANGASPGASFDLAYPAGPETVRSYLQRNPMEVVLRAQMTSFVPFVPVWTVEARKAGYREIANASSYPPRLDCRGNLVNAGSSGAANCPCASNPDDPTVIDAGGSCICAGANMAEVTGANNQTCACQDSNTIFNPSSQACENCPERQAVSGGQCACTDPTTSLANDCCPDGQFSSNGVCCALGETGSGGRCCPEGQADSGGLCCPIGQTNNAGECGCPNESETYNPDSQRCECEQGEGNVPGGDSCVDCSSLGKVLVGGLCCDSGEVYAGGRCCPRDTPTNVGGACAQCPAGQSQDAAGNCRCPGSLVPQGNGCGCTGGFTQEGDQCTCPNGTLLNGYCVTQE